MASVQSSDVNPQLHTPDDSKSNSNELADSNFLETQKFLEKNSQNPDFSRSSDKWIHNPPPPYSVYKYIQSRRFSDRLDINKTNDAFYKPIAVFEPLSHQSTRTSSDPRAPPVSPDNKDMMDKLQTIDGSPHAFAGLLTVPRISMQNPAGADQPAQQIGALTYHQHIPLGETAYVFGGLYSHQGLDFSHVGLPKDVDISKVSVHLPVDLPPHIDRDILASPYLVPNSLFYLFNSDRGSLNVVTHLSYNCPYDLCSATYTIISPRHIFVFGGFRVVIKLVQHNQHSDRWVMEKDIVMNDVAYVLDVMTLKFTTITLNKRPEKEAVTDTNFEISRIGNALEANMYEKIILDDTANSTRTGTPSNFMDSSHLRPYIPTSDSPSKSGTTSPVLKPRTSSSAGSHTFTVNKTAMHGKSHLHSESATPVSTNSSNHGKLHKQSTDSDSLKSRSRGSHSSKESKKTGTLGKVIDRIHHSLPSRQTSPHDKAETTSPNHQHMTMASSYSNQVKQHRSNSGSMNSRPVSPTPQHTMHSPKPISLQREENKSVTIDDELSIARELDEACSCGSCEYCISLGRAPRSPNDLHGDTFVKPGSSLTSVYVFGGFVKNGAKFEASNDLLRIDLVCNGEFFSNNLQKEAIIYKVKLHDSSNYPSPRGFFASTLVNDSKEDEEDCDWNQITRPWSPNSIFDDETSSSNSIQTSNSRHHTKSFKIKTPEEFFSSKALLVQGGCNENRETFANMYIFKFQTGKWEDFSTYCYNYFDKPKNPTDDEFTEELIKSNEIKHPDLIEAELRASHHTALYYSKPGRELVFFVGGFSNHYLRHVDPEPYESDKFDVSRLAKFVYPASNSEVCRILVYNLKTQTWGFYKYYYDFRRSVSGQVIDTLQKVPQFMNANVYYHGSGVSLEGKSITICNGLIIPVADKKDDYEYVSQLFPGESVMLGCYLQITFPSL